jgi:hypothetical protein
MCRLDTGTPIETGNRKPHIVGKCLHVAPIEVSQTYGAFEVVVFVCVCVIGCGPDYCAGMICMYGRAYDADGCIICDCNYPCEVTKHVCFLNRCFVLSNILQMHVGLMLSVIEMYAVAL